MFKCKRIRHSTKRLQLKQAAATREAKEEGDIEHGIGVLGFGCVRRMRKKKAQRQVVEWGTGCRGMIWMVSGNEWGRL